MPAWSITTCTVTVCWAPAKSPVTVTWILADPTPVTLSPSSGVTTVYPDASWDSEMSVAPDVMANVARESLLKSSVDPSLRLRSTRSRALVSTEMGAAAAGSPVRVRRVTVRVPGPG